MWVVLRTDADDGEVVTMVVDLVVDKRRALLRIVPPGEPEGDVDAAPCLPSNLKSSSLRRPAKVGGGGVRSSSGIVASASGEAITALFFWWP